MILDTDDLSIDNIISIVIVVCDWIDLIYDWCLGNELPNMYELGSFNICSAYVK